MLYKQYDQLTIIKMRNDIESIPFTKLVEIIMAKPSNIIYCEFDGKLYGIISMGDIARAHDMALERVAVNKCFTSIFTGEYMKARDIFGKNQNINALPVVGEGGELLGAYSRWDDLLLVQYMLKLERDNNVMTEWRNNQVVLVRPCYVFARNLEIFCQFWQYLLLKGINVNCIDYENVVDYVSDGEEWILFSDEDERRAIDTLLSFILNNDFDRNRLSTYQRFIIEIDYEIMNVFLKKLRREGVYIVNLFYSEKEYSHLLKKRIEEKFVDYGEEVSNLMLPEMYREFFDDLYTKEYADQILHIRHLVESKSGLGKLKDCHSTYYNVINGERYTVSQPDCFNKSIYFFGPCFIYGHYAEDRFTVESFLQKQINESEYRARVINCGSPSYSLYINMELARIIDTPFRKGDIVVLYSNNRRLTGVNGNLDLMDSLKKHSINIAWIVDIPPHCNHNIHSLYAKAIYDMLKPVLKENTNKVGELIKGDRDFIKMLYIDRYFADFDRLLNNKIGAIVMNCNPFTYGHRYLIEQALRNIDFLIIFVVEEDKSMFSFAERFAMVCDGVADLDKIKVVPSGPFILSQMTFPEYFIKEADEDIVENVENDITIFAEKIASHLNIRYR